MVTLKRGRDQEFSIEDQRLMPRGTKGEKRPTDVI